MIKCIAHNIIGVLMHSKTAKKYLQISLKEKNI